MCVSTIIYIYTNEHIYLGIFQTLLFKAMLIPIVHVLCFKHLPLSCLLSLLLLCCVRKISTPVTKYLRDTREGNASHFQSMTLASFVTCSDTRQEVGGEPVIVQI